MSSSEIVILGRLLDPYGIRGWIRLHPFGDDPLTWARMPAWWVGEEQGPWREVAVKGMKAHGDGVVVLLEGVADRDSAEALKGQFIGAPREALPVTAEDEFYWADLIGLSVVNGAGESLGQVVGLIETGANDVLRVQLPGEPERLLPFVDAVVKTVDRANRQIVVEWGLDW